ncbi:MAG: hypothetical protein ACRYFV_13620 [Janthinobacterium lividum]
MQTTVNSATAHGSGVVGTAVATAAIAFGMAYFAVSSAIAEESAEMDTTERLLSGGNRARTLAALERYNRGEFVSQELIEL